MSIRELRQGENAPVEATRARLAVSWPARARCALDAFAFLLGAEGTVRGDADVVSRERPAATEGAVTLTADRDAAAFEIAFGIVPAEIQRMVFCAAVRDDDGALAELDGMSATLMPAGAPVDLRFRPALAGAAERAMVLMELYRRGGAWKARAVGQGFSGGPATLGRSFGIEVQHPGAAKPVPPPAGNASSKPAPVSLAKVTLDRPGQSVSLEKKGASFGEIAVNLNWSRGRGGLFGGGAIDLDLGCLFELSDGRKGVVQSLGRSFGAFDTAPFVQLSGDDRTGDVGTGETLRINGTRWNDIRRIVVFADIYDGVPSWQRTDGVVLVTAPDQPPIEVRLTEGRNDRRLCAIALLENVDGRVRTTRAVEYMGDQRDLDRRFGWGLRWTVGRKD